MEVKVHKAQKQGWLCKGNKKKKLIKSDKQYWFALDEAYLYYFTDDTGTTLKGKFPLVLYDQCEVNELNKKQFVLYSSIDKEKNSVTLFSTSEELAKEWVDSIKSKILESKDIYMKYGPGKFRKEYMLYIKIEEAKDLPQSYSAYCVIFVDDVQRARTPSSEKTSSPTFYQEYDMNINASNKTVTILLKGQRLIKGDCLVGSFKKDLADIKEGIDSWVPLVSNDGKYCGSLLLRIEYIVLTILPDEHYEDLFHMLMKDNMSITKKLSTLPMQNTSCIADSLLRAFDSRKLSVHFIKELIVLEIQNTSNAEILFRSNSVATKALDLFMKLAGSEYLKKVLKPIIIEIYQGKKSCEIDPSKCKYTLIGGNYKNLTNYVECILQSILISLNYCPSSFRDIFKHIREHVRKKFPKDKNVKYIGPNGFIFLRFFCPAILNPMLFGIMNDFPSKKVNRDLTLIAKTLQNIANMSVFTTGKEFCMRVLNDFVREKIPIMKKYINRLCSPLLEPIDELPNKRNIIFGREMSIIHNRLSGLLPSIKDNFDSFDFKNLNNEIKRINHEMNSVHLLHSNSQPLIEVRRRRKIKTVKSQPPVKRNQSVKESNHFKENLF